MWLTSEKQNPGLTKLDVVVFSTASAFWSVVVSDDPEKEGMVDECVCQGEVSGVRKERFKIKKIK